MQIDHPNFVSAEIEYTYLNAVKGNGPVRTLRIRVDAELSNASVAAAVLELLRQRINSDDAKHFDHLSIVGAAADWPADRESKAKETKEFFDRLLGKSSK